MGSPPPPPPPSPAPPGNQQSVINRHFLFGRSSEQKHNRSPYQKGHNRQAVKSEPACELPYSYNDTRTPTTIHTDTQTKRAVPGFLHMFHSKNNIYISPRMPELENRNNTSQAHYSGAGRSHNRTIIPTTFTSLDNRA